MNMNYKKYYTIFNKDWFSSRKYIWDKYLPQDQIITHNTIIEKIIDNTNIDWTNPNLKICDPCCGSGSFLIYCLIKLLEAGHSEKHIIENMLYGTDINSDCIHFIEVFWKFNRYKHNLKTSSILSKNWSFKNMHFDLMIMNPPFKEPKIPGQKRSGKNLDTRIWDTCLKLKPKEMYCIMSETSSRSNSHNYTFREDISKFEGVTIATGIVGYKEGSPKITIEKKQNLIAKHNWVAMNKVTNGKALKDFYKPCTRTSTTGKQITGMGYLGPIPNNHIGIAHRTSYIRPALPGEILMNQNGKKECQTVYLFDFTGYDLNKVATYIKNTGNIKFKEYCKNFNDIDVCRGFWECFEIPDSCKLKK